MTSRVGRRGKKPLMLYIKSQQTYHPSSEGMKKVYVSSPVTEISAHYFVCCPNGIYKGNVKPRKTSKKPLQQKETKKMGYIYIFCMYVDELHSGQVTV